MSSSSSSLIFLLALIIGALVVVVTHALPQRKPSSPCQHYHDADFDYYLLSLQWPGNVCKTQQHKECRVPPQVSNFTIHGLWPNSYTIFHGPTCCQNIPFDPSALNPLMRSLEAEWPSFFNPNEGFWSHEWLKHGTCSQLGSEFAYFQTTLNIKHRLPLLAALNKAGVRPGSSKISTSQIINAIKDQLNVPVVLTCSGGAYVSEFHFCLDKQFQFMECPAESRNKATGTSESCDASVYMLPIH